MTKKKKDITLSVPEGMEFNKSYTIDTTLHNELYWDTERNMPHKSEEAKDRKNTPVFSGVLKYFPDAIKEISRVSLAGNNQHHPDKPLHWDRNKSTDELDALTRHLIDAGSFDSDGIRHSAKVAWRALANLQKELENER
tara:strand:- start:4476 stop:4892 length:417 start_codon:yes stop_codon:yes gene_type:complete